jgi:hypothetical protein
VYAPGRRTPANPSSLRANAHRNSHCGPTVAVLTTAGSRTHPTGTPVERIGRKLLVIWQDEPMEQAQSHLAGIAPQVILEPAGSSRGQRPLKNLGA